ncbi:hypothetical protein ES705_19693 [subsurface metagenome]
MKAGGINTIATYVFWIMHEEKEGEFNWQGDNNLRKFIELCKANNIDVIVRIGPFCHGEIRNGGLPDWLLGKPLIIRSNDKEYLFHVERLYQQIGEQLEGLLFKDGGPVIGIQIENEYQHSAAPWGLTYPGQPHDFTVAEQDRAATQEGVGMADENNPYEELGNEHMKVLKSLAIKAGLDVPLYTATGWGYAAIIENGSIPVTSAYPFPTWADIELSPLYLYQDLQKTPDYSPVRYKSIDYPVIAAEIGGGIMCTYARRPTVPPKSLDALINRFLGSGANGIGYYMYHGGSTPRGKSNYYSDEAYGYPKISYDFQAPLSEYGQVKPSFNRLKVLHYFTESFGEILAPMEVVLPDKRVSSPENIKDLRYSVRKKGSSGFIFYANYQDHLETNEFKNISFTVNTNNGEVRIPESDGFNLPSEENMIFPFNFDLGGVTIQYATAQPLLHFSNSNTQFYVFFAPEGIQPEFSVSRQKGVILNGSSCVVDENDNRWLIRCDASNAVEFVFGKSDGSTIQVLVINREQAEKSWLLKKDSKTFVVFSDATVIQEKDFIKFLQTGKNRVHFQIYPKDEYNMQSNEKMAEMSSGSIDLFSSYQIELSESELKIDVKEIDRNKLSVNIPDQMPESVNDLILQIDYMGDTGMGFLNGRLAVDNFYNGSVWEIGLRTMMNEPGEKKLTFYFRPLYENASYYEDFKADQIPDFTNNNQVLKINSIEVVPEYKALLKIY